MNRQYLINGLVGLAVVALIWWIASNTYWEEYESNTGLQGEALTNPFYAAERLAGSLGAHATSRHEIISVPSTNAVIVLGYWNWGLIPERRERIERWVKDGGRLVVSSYALNDKEFTSWTGVTRSFTRPSSGNKTEPTKPQCRPGARCPPSGPATTDDPDKPNRRWVICTLAEVTFLSTSRKASWRLNDTRSRPQILRIPIGRGSVTIINAEPFAEDSLTCGDNALLFVEATQLRAGDHIEFLTEATSASLLQLIWQYGAPIVMLAAVLIVLWLWRSGVRFGPLMAVPDPARRSLAEQIRGTGRFTLRFGGGAALHAAAVRALNETAARRVPHYERLSGETRIERLAPLAGLSAAALSAALDGRVARNPHELRKAVAILEQARRHMSNNS